MLSKEKQKEIYNKIELIESKINKANVLYHQFRYDKSYYKDLLNAISNFYEDVCEDHLNNSSSKKQEKFMYNSLRNHPDKDYRKAITVMEKRLKKEKGIDVENLVKIYELEQKNKLEQHEELSN